MGLLEMLWEHLALLQVMDIANSNEALRLVARDLKEGADMVMIKPECPILTSVEG